MRKNLLEVPENILIEWAAERYNTVMNEWHNWDHKERWLAAIDTCKSIESEFVVNWNNGDTTTKIEFMNINYHEPVDLAIFKIYAWYRFMGALPKLFASYTLSEKIVDLMAFYRIQFNAYSKTTALDRRKKLLAQSFEKFGRPTKDQKAKRGEVIDYIFDHEKKHGQDAGTLKTLRSSIRRYVSRRLNNIQE